MAERLVTLDPNVTLKARQSLLPPWNPQYVMTLAHMYT